MFVGHTDVVTEGDRRAWSVDPYEAVLRDGRIHGRGAADMKGGLAAMMVAAADLVADGPFPGRLVLAALVDEEGLMLGSKRLAAGPWVRGVDGVIVCEPEGGEICTCAKGAIRIRVELTGAMAHGAMPDLARNPLPVAARIVAALGQVERDLVAASGRHELLGRASVTPTVLQAGDPDQINVVPGSATVAFDVRTIPGVDHAALVDTLTAAVLDSAAGTDVDARVTVLDDRPVVDTPRDHPLVTTLAAAHEAVTGEPARYGGVPGATDGTILSRDAGLATVVYGPGGKWIAHQADEYVEVADLVTTAAVYRHAAARFFRGES
jgi:succinyl-diaminopimelate desuccinylase